MTDPSGYNRYWLEVLEKDWHQKRERPVWNRYDRGNTDKGLLTEVFQKCPVSKFPFLLTRTFSMNLFDHSVSHWLPFSLPSLSQSPNPPSASPVCLHSLAAFFSKTPEPRRTEWAWPGAHSNWFVTLSFFPRRDSDRVCQTATRDCQNFRFGVCSLAPSPSTTFSRTEGNAIRSVFHAYWTQTRHRPRSQTRLIVAHTRPIANDACRGEFCIFFPISSKLLVIMYLLFALVAFSPSPLANTQRLIWQTEALREISLLHPLASSHSVFCFFVPPGTNDSCSSSLRLVSLPVITQNYYDASRKRNWCENGLEHANRLPDLSCISITNPSKLKRSIWPVHSDNRAFQRESREI